MNTIWRLFIDCRWLAGGLLASVGVAAVAIRAGVAPLIGGTILAAGLALSLAHSVWREARRAPAAR